MNIQPILYETTRNLYNLEDKLSIAVLILFSWKLGSKTFSNLLYTKNLKKFIKSLNKEYKDYEVNLDVRINDQGVKDALIKTIDKVRQTEDKDGYLKALFENDEFALVIDDLVNYKFDSKELNNELKKLDQIL